MLALHRQSYPVSRLRFGRTSAGVLDVQQMSGNAGGVRRLAAHRVNEALHHLVKRLCGRSALPYILQKSSAITMLSNADIRLTSMRVS